MGHENFRICIGPWAKSPQPNSNNFLYPSDVFPWKNNVPKRFGPFDVRKVSETPKYTKTGSCCAD
jgi:hypothetical protein